MTALESIFMTRIEKLTSFIEKNPADFFSQHALAMEWIKLGDDQQAEKLLRAILGQKETYTGSYYHLGKLLEKKAEVVEAMQVYKKGITVCESVEDKHSLRELKAALAMLNDGD